MYQYGLSCVLVSAALPNTTDLEAYSTGLAYFYSASLFHETLLDTDQVCTELDRDFVIRGHPHFRSFLMRKLDMTRASELYLLSLQQLSNFVLEAIFDFHSHHTELPYATTARTSNAFAGSHT